MCEQFAIFDHYLVISQKQYQTET